MFVLDCSVTMSWCLQDETSHYGEKVLDLLTHQQAIVPSLWHLEVMNVLMMAQKRKRISQKNTMIVLNTLSQLNIQTDKISININNTEFVDFSNQHQLTSYDASYLYLAKREQIPLATLDKKMQISADNLSLYLTL